MSLPRPTGGVRRRRALALISQLREAQAKLQVGSIRLVIFSEGDAARGLGHLNRCLAYAEYVRARNGSVRWVVDGDAAAGRTLADGWPVDLRAWQADPTVAVDPDEIAIVDSYSATDAVMAAVARQARRTVFIDDYVRADYPTGPVSPGLVVHATPGPVQPRGRAQWLTGPLWQPLKPAFSDIPRRDAVPRTVGRVLVAFGATDLRGLAGPAVGWVRQVFPDAAVDVILGQGVAHTDPALDAPGVTIHHRLAPDAVARLMTAADLAVGAAGQTLYEWACCGLPGVLVGVAENQRPHMDRWPPTGAFLAAGWWDNPDIAARAVVALKALAPPEPRLAAARAGQAAVDGRGVERLFERLSTDTTDSDAPT